MEDLPVDIKLEIFSRLPPEPLLKCKLVCKTWEKLLSDRKVGLLFLIINPPAERNLQLYYGSYDEIYGKANSGEEFPHKCLTKINHPRISWIGFLRTLFIDQMVGSCNGLVCIRVPHHKVLDPVYICNPITTEYINLPRIKHKKGFVVSGFGYHPSNNKYKVIRIHYPDRMYSDKPVTTKGSVEIYTLGSGTGWRNIGEIDYAISGRGALANGSLYWLDHEQANIVAFNLLSEEFRVLAVIPPCLDSRSDIALYKQRRTSCQIKVLGGNLCFVYRELDKDLHIWSYRSKQENCDVKEDVWSLEFCIPASTIVMYNEYEPFSLTRNNEVLMWVNKRGICCYDKKTESLKVLVEDDFRLGYCRGIPHMNCPLSMKSLGEKLKTRKNQHKKKKVPGMNSPEVYLFFCTGMNPVQKQELKHELILLESVDLTIVFDWVGFARMAFMYPIFSCSCSFPRSFPRIRVV